MFPSSGDEPAWSWSWSGKEVRSLCQTASALCPASLASSTPPQPAMKYHPGAFSEISQGVPGCLYRWMSSVVHAAPVSTVHCVALLVATVGAVTVAASPRLSTQSPSQPPSQSPLLVAVCGGGCGGTASGCSRRWACLGTVSAVATVAAPVSSRNIHTLPGAATRSTSASKIS